MEQCGRARIWANRETEQAYARHPPTLPPSHSTKNRLTALSQSSQRYSSGCLQVLAARTATSSPCSAATAGAATAVAVAPAPAAATAAACPYDTDAADTTELLRLMSFLLLRFLVRAASRRLLLRLASPTPMPLPTSAATDGVGGDTRAG